MRARGESSGREAVAGTKGWKVLVGTAMMWGVSPGEAGLMWLECISGGSWQRERG